MPGIVGLDISRQHQLGNVANAANRRRHLLRMDRIAQPKDVRVRCQDGEARALVAVLDHRAVDENPLLRSELENEAAHGVTCRSPRPRMTAVLISISAAASASPARMRRLCCRVNSAR